MTASLLRDFEAISGHLLDRSGKFLDTHDSEKIDNTNDHELKVHYLSCIPPFTFSVYDVAITSFFYLSFLLSWSWRRLQRCNMAANTSWELVATPRLFFLSRPLFKFFSYFLSVLLLSLFGRLIVPTGPTFFSRRDIVIDMRGKCKCFATKGQVDVSLLLSLSNETLSIDESTSLVTSRAFINVWKVVFSSSFFFF